METKCPLTIRYPPGAQIAVPSTWRRLPTGEIEATYHTYQELYWSVTLSQWLREWSNLPSPWEGLGEGQPHQAQLFPVKMSGAAYEL
jgi:hypothetical protein